MMNVLPVYSHHNENANCPQQQTLRCIMKVVWASTPNLLDAENNETFEVTMAFYLLQRQYIRGDTHSSLLYECVLPQQTSAHRIDARECKADFYTVYQ